MKIQDIVNYIKSRCKALDLGPIRIQVTFSEENGHFDMGVNVWFGHFPFVDHYMWDTFDMQKVSDVSFKESINDKISEAYRKLKKKREGIEVDPFEVEIEMKD